MKQYYCLLKKFNNYFNRKIIKYETLSDYQDNSEDFFIPETTEGEMKPFDFNPNDNVTTEIYVNDVPFDPDYFLLLDEEQNIVQRWYVLEQRRTRQGQWQYFLRRDVIVDNLNSLTYSPVFVQKAWLEDGNSLILNSEGMNFNRIKKSETLLKDFSNSAWYIAYLSKNKGGSGINLQIPAGKVEGSLNLSDLASAIGITEAYLTTLLNFNGDTTTPARFVKDIGFSFYTRGESLIPDGKCAVWWNYDLGNFRKWSDTDMDGDSFPLFVETLGAQDFNYLLDRLNTAAQENKAAFLSALPTIMNVTAFLSTANLNILQSYQGSYIYYLSKYYKLNVIMAGTDTKTEDSHFDDSKYPILRTIVERTGELSYPYFRAITTSEVGGFLGFQTNADKVYIQLVEVSDDQNIPIMELDISSSRKQTLDQQYDIIAFPAESIEFELKDANNDIYSFISSGEICRRIVTALGIQEDANIYDIQLLPYCPLDKIKELYDLTLHEDYDLILDNSSPAKEYGVVFYISSASFQQRLDYSLGIIESMKIDNECDLYRLIAPNYQGVFEFNVAKNGGAVNFFTAYCTYKPYTPFIKITPDFNYIYGTDFNDNRGLICAGDFSMPRVNSAWESYQLNNKNYQNIFNREIQNLEVMQGIERTQQAVTGGIGIFTDALKGGVAGGLVSGSGWGAAAGALASGIASAAGYAVDKDMLAIQHREQKSLAIDKFNYQLGNIKALPYSLTKVGAFDISSKIFPVLEYYTCTDQEKEALRLKLKYESMTVMKIANFGDFYRAYNELKYFKGELIRCDDIADDNHMLEAIYSEIMKGVYM